MLTSMGRHALRAVPWSLLGVATALTTVLLRVLATNPYVLWPLQGIAVGLVAGTTAWLFDEPAASVVDALPRGLPWRTTARGLVAVVLAGWWLASVWWTRTAYFGHAGAVAGQGLAAMLGVVALVTWLRSRHIAAPANAVSAAVVLGLVMLALTRPMPHLLPLLPYTAAGPWRASAWWWAVIAVAVVVVLVVAVAGSPRYPHEPAPPHRSSGGSVTVHHGTVVNRHRADLSRSPPRTRRCAPAHPAGHRR